MAALHCIMVMFAFIFIFSEVRGYCLERHKSLLLSFKHSLVIDDFLLVPDYGKSSKLANWNSSTDCCLWPGVTCSGTFVTGLDLSNEGIVGGFNDSSSLFDLTSLISLNLAYMDQDTVIPSDIGRLVNLMNLNISGSSFIGQIPIEISNLTRLVSLDLSLGYDLKAENPNLGMLVGNLSNLIDLRLDNVNLSSQSREWCQVLSSSTPHLQVLSLYQCELLGPIHDSLQNLTHLSIVDLSYNNFSDPIPYGVFASLENLTSLKLSRNEFNGVFPHTMVQLPSLRYLDISFNDDLESSPSITFQNSSSLETLLLYGTRFSKTIPESIGEAKMLSDLYLWNCNLSGQIPESISQLEHLVYLDLSHNNLDGHIPSFSRSRNLTVLRMNDNQLNGSILATDWKKLHQMERLILLSNNLSGSVPACLFETPSLKILNLGKNHFTGFTDESNITISSSHLQSLYLDDNGFQGSFPPFIYGLNNLKYLDLSFNNWSDTFHSDLLVQVLQGNNFPSFLQLRSLGLASCNLKQFPPFLTNLSILENLYLSDNQIDGHIPDHIWNMTTLLSLNLSHNRLEFWGMEEFASHLKHLDLSSNKLHGSIPKSICYMTNLNILDLSNNSFSGALPQCWPQLRDLFVLNLSKNNIISVMPDTFSSSYGLKTLDLSQNSFQGTIPKSLEGCINLEVLDLGYNQLHDMFPCWMNKLDQLLVLVLRSNSLYGSIRCLNHNFNLSRLQIVDIASNNFGGNLPAQGLLSWKAMMVDKRSTYEMEMGYLQYVVSKYNQGDFTEYVIDSVFTDSVLVTVKGLKWNLIKISTIYTLVDFSDNKFEGNIPCELRELKFLYALNLSDNHLSGQIPSSFGNFYRIESLDLSKNELSGKIPRQLASLNFLSALNLSFNHLEGMIPKGRQFQTFTESSFKGNKGLCGPPLNTSCGNEDVTPNPSIQGEDKLGDDFEFKDIFISTEIGYALGLGLVIMPLLFWSTWRKRYYKYIDKVLNSMCCHHRQK